MKKQTSRWYEERGNKKEANTRTLTAWCECAVRHRSAPPPPTYNTTEKTPAHNKHYEGNSGTAGYAATAPYVTHFGCKIEHFIAFDTNDDYLGRFVLDIIIYSMLLTGQSFLLHSNLKYLLF